MNTFTMVIPHIAKWFHANWLILNVDKTNIVKFTPPNLSCNPLTIVYDGELLTEAWNFKLLSPHIDKHLNWQRQNEKLLPKLNVVCYTIREVSSVLKSEVLRLVYFENFQSLLEYGIIFSGNSSPTGYIFFTSKKCNENYDSSYF